MDFNINKSNYNEFINYLYSLQDIKYKNFHSKIVLANDLIGIRTPILKEIAKKIAKHDYNTFIKVNNHKIYEEKILHGLLLGYINTDFDKIKILINEFLPYIDNWAICDITVSNLKIFKKNKKSGFYEIKNYIKSNNFWINRFGYVLLLNYYIDSSYIDKIFKLCETYKDEYYVKMSIAWLLSMCYIKYKEKTLKFLTQNKLEKWTYNKTIQKIIESNRVEKNEKETLKKLKKY